MQMARSDTCGGQSMEKQHRETRGQGAQLTSSTDQKHPAAKVALLPLTFAGGHSAILLLLPPIIWH